MKTMKTTLMTCMMIITTSPVPKRRGKVLLMFITYATFALHYLVSESYITNPSHFRCYESDRPRHDLKYYCDQYDDPTSSQK